jgi:hypothetical protein
MPTEDSYFVTGPGRHFRSAADLARRGATEETLVPVIVRSLRKEIRKNGGPAGLARLATRVGIGSPDRLPLTASANEMECALEQHALASISCGSQRNADLEVSVVRQEWTRLQHQSGSPRSMRELHEDWCVALTRTLLLGRIEGMLPGRDPTERRSKIQVLERGIRGSLRGVDADIIDGLALDPDGGNVRVRGLLRKMTTEELLNEPLADCASAIDLEDIDADETTDLSVRFREQP